MKLVTFVVDGNEKLGTLKAHGVIDIREARALQLLYQGLPVDKAVEKACCEIPDCMIKFIEGGEETLAIAKEAEKFALEHKEFGSILHHLKDVTLKPPVPRPPMVLNTNGSLYRPFAVSGFKFKSTTPTGLIGPFGTIVIPKEISDFGAVFECELAIVIGKKGRRIANDRTAYDYVYGYTVYNDVTDYGKQIEGIFNFKICDTFCSIGPCIVTKDEIKNPHNVTKRAWVNGKLATECNPEALRKIPEFVSAPSKTFTLHPGTIISTGAPNAGRIKPGDVIELEIPEIGKMRQPVIAER